MSEQSSQAIVTRRGAAQTCLDFSCDLVTQKLRNVLTVSKEGNTRALSLPVSWQSCFTDQWRRPLHRYPRDAPCVFRLSLHENLRVGTRISITDLQLKLSCENDLTQEVLSCADRKIENIVKKMCLWRTYFRSCGRAFDEFQSNGNVEPRSTKIDRHTRSSQRAP